MTRAQTAHDDRPAQFAGDAAQSRRRARLALAFGGILCGIALRAQDPAGADPTLRLFAQEAARLAKVSTDPVVRGEAALVLAATRDVHHYETVLAVAGDKDEPARLRGILALGYLGSAGSELRLDDILADSATRPRPDGIAAAYALGLLPENTAPAEVTACLVRFLQSSFKRQRDVLLALLVALSGHRATAQREALLRLYDDAANRDGVVRAALLDVLGRIPGGVDKERVNGALRRGGAEERRAALALLAAQEQPDKELLPYLARMAAQDPDPGARAGALAVLTRMRHLPALDLAAHAIRAGAPVEVAQGMRTALQLGGSGMRRAIEQQFGKLPPANQTVVLQEFKGPMTDEFAAVCLEVAANRRLECALRIAAATALAQAEVRRAAPVVRTLFLEAEEPMELIDLARAMMALEEEPPQLARLHRGAHADELALASDRVRALLVAGHPQIARFCLQELQRPDLEPAMAQSLLRAIRRAELPPPAAAALPAPLPELLR